MPFTYEKPAAVAGEWVAMRDLAKVGEPVVLSAGFLTEDLSNSFEGKPNPRYIVAGVVDGDEAIKVSVPLGTGYSRGDLLQKADAYLQENPTETISIVFVKTQGSKYIDIELAS
jgi:hypothetical protein